MKILLLDVNCKNSSTGKIVYDIYQYANANGHEAAIAYGRGSVVDEKNIYRFAPKWEVYLHALLTRLTGYTGCFSHVATKRLFKIMDEFKPDVVHLNDMHGYFVDILPLMEYLKLHDIKTVWTQHCEFMYTGKCGYSYECDKWQNECGDCPHLHDYPSVQWFDRTTKMFRQKKAAFKDWDNLTIVTPSPWLNDRVEKSFLGNKHLRIVYNGVDTGVFNYKAPENLASNNEQDLDKVIEILAVAPDIMDDRKGGEYVLKLAELLKDIAGITVHYTLIGVSDKDKEQLQSDKKLENITLLSPIFDQSLLANYYRKADVFLLCSKRETYSMTTVEALCCGTTVVGFLAGAPETIALPDFSKFVEYGNIEKLKQAIVDMVEFENSFEDKNSLRDKISKCAIDTYSRERMADSYMKIYEGN